MKKTALAILIGGLAWAVFFSQAVRADELEKIPSPDQMKYYQVIKRENGTLFGIRLKNPEKRSQATSTSLQLERIPSPEEIKNFKMIKKENGILFGVRIKETEEQKKNLEKISSPNLLSLYEDVKKVDDALWGVKKRSASTTPATKPVRVVVKPESLACVQAAITAKDTALIVNVKQFAASAEAAISARSECQLSALGKTEGQFAALDACTRSFKDAMTKMQKEQRGNHQKAWTEYRAALKACQPTTNTEDKAEIIIEDGGVSADSLISGSFVQ